MIDKYLKLGFKNLGQFSLNNNELSFKRIYTDYNPSNIIWLVCTDKEAVYVGETIDAMNIVLKDIVNGNRNRATRDKVHSLIKEFSFNDNVYFLVCEASKHSKHSLIELFSPIGNKNGVIK
jgi:hypothetical protein